MRETRILELAADLDRVRLGSGPGGAARDQSILCIAERMNLCRRGFDDSVDVNKACPPFYIPNFACLVLLVPKRARTLAAVAWIEGDDVNKSRPFL